MTDDRTTVTPKQMIDSAEGTPKQMMEQNTGAGNRRNTEGTKTADRDMVETAKQRTEQGMWKKLYMKLISCDLNQGLHKLLNRLIQRICGNEGARFGSCNCFPHIYSTYPLLGHNAQALPYNRSRTGESTATCIY